MLPRELRIRAARFALTAGCAATSGCGDAPEGRLPLHPVRGSVLYLGKPLPKALVVFEPVQPGRVGGQEQPSSTGVVGDDGSFRLTTYEPADGAPAGDYRVKVMTNASRDDGPGLVNPKAAATGDVLKGRYANSAASGLIATVKEGSNELPPFDLK